jgi:hypothetical protein
VNLNFKNQLSHKLRLLSHPLDRVAIGLLLALSLVLGLLLLSGSHTVARVRDFSWANQPVNAAETAFTMTFSRPMDQASVAQALKIEPPLPGRISWSGRRMTYTLNQPIEYGRAFSLQLQGAKERFQQNKPIQDFSAAFSSRDRVFAFIGAIEDQVDRLVLVNMSQKDQRILTPSNLKVMDFYAYPDRSKILFSAIDRATLAPNALPSPAEQKLYTVTTGLGGEASGKDVSRKEVPGKIELVLDNQEFQNLKFALADDGQVIVVQRVNRRNTNEFAPWIIRPGQAPSQLKTQQPGGDFLITPDSSAIAIAQGQGLAILPLQDNQDPLGFLPKFGTVLGFSRDGSMAAMLKYNTDFTRSLFIVTNQGIQKEVLKITGSVRNAIFDPTHNLLYCLLTELQPGETYQEQPYLAVMDLKTALESDPKVALKPLAKLPKQREIQISLAPDGRAVLFDQTANDPNVPQAANADLAKSRIWILPTETLINQDWQTKVSPLELLPGFHPRWLP